MPGRSAAEFQKAAEATKVACIISKALARVPMDVRPGDTVHVVIRDKPLAARVVKPPFARNGKILVNV